MLARTDLGGLTIWGEAVRGGLLDRHRPDFQGAYQQPRVVYRMLCHSHSEAVDEKTSQKAPIQQLQLLYRMPSICIPLLRCCRYDRYSTMSSL